MTLEKETLGVFVHLHYAELADEVCSYLKLIPFDYAVYISTDTSEKAEHIHETFVRCLPKSKTVVKVTPNRGWDIAPFVVGFAEEIKAHPFGLKLHGKKSDNQKDPLWGLKWRTYLFCELVGSARRALDVLGLLRSKPDLGMVAPPHWSAVRPWISVGQNFPQMKSLLARVGVEISPKQKIDFPSGSMFWFRREALEPLLSLGLKFEDFDAPSNDARDATLAHAIERSFYFFCEKAGLSWTVFPAETKVRYPVASVVKGALDELLVKSRVYARVATLVHAKAKEKASSVVRKSRSQLSIGAGWLKAIVAGNKERQRSAEMMWAIEQSDLFDDRLYREKNPGVSPAPIGALADYVTNGWRRHENPHRWFDTKYYVAQMQDAGLETSNPLYDYVTRGWREGRSPHPDFDSVWYRRRHPDVLESGIEPLSHYLQFGRAEGRQTRRVYKSARATVFAPERSAWMSVSRRANVLSASVTVVIPVYRGYDETLACIYSVLSNRQKAEFELVVINDAGPDEKLNEVLGELGSEGYFTYLVNGSNKGFVFTANRGIELYRDRDVILLNSDAVVYGDWIDRMLAHAYSDKAIATITPFSNNATICSYPSTNTGFDLELEVPFEQIDRIAAEVNAGSRNDVPTGVGFCFFMSRRAIEAIGVLDSETFGHGYGEENDFCRRAAKAGYKNVLAHDIFVFHAGAVSFSEDSKKMIDAAQIRLHSKHPEYPDLVRDYVLSDPSRAARTRMDARRIVEALGKQPYLFITHRYGGGIERNINDLIDISKADSVPVVIARVSEGARISIERPESIEFLEIQNLENLDVRNTELTADILKLICPRLIHVHSVAGLNQAAIVELLAMLERSEIPYVFTWHDHMPLCHRIQFILPNGRYCGEPSTESCRECVANDRSAIDEFDPAERHRVFAKFLAGAEIVLCPSHNAAARAARLVHTDKLIVRPHIEPLSPGGWIEQPAGSAAIKIAIIGALLSHKGADLLVQMAADAEARELPIQFVLVGYTTREEFEQFRCVKVTGKYSSEQEALAILKREKPHICLLPSIWPETYCYTLSIAFHAGIPPVVFDIGAQAERVRERGWGRVLPYGAQASASVVNDLLTSLPIDELWAERVLAGNVRKLESLADYYSAKHN